MDNKNGIRLPVHNYMEEKDGKTVEQQIAERNAKAKEIRDYKESKKSLIEAMTEEKTITVDGKDMIVNEMVEPYTVSDLPHHKVFPLEEKVNPSANQQAIGNMRADKKSLQSLETEVAQKQETINTLKTKLMIDENKDTLSDEKFLQHAPKAAKAYFVTLDEATKLKVKDMVEYTEDGINFTIQLDGKKMVVPFTKENSKHENVGEGKAEKIRTESIKVNGETMQETYFEWDYLNDTYLKNGTPVNHCLETKIGYIPVDTLYESLMNTMPAGDVGNRGNWGVAGKQMYGLLGGVLSGYRSAGSSDSIGYYGYLWSASARSTDGAWAVTSGSTRGRLDSFSRNFLFPLRVLRTPPYEA